MTNAIIREFSRRRIMRVVQFIEGGYTVVQERAQDALRAARVTVEWNEHEWDEHSDPEAGEVRLRIEPDNDIDLSWLDDNHPPKYRAEQLDRVNRDGAWGMIGEYFDGQDWRQADSVWGFIATDWKDSGYDIDIKRSTLDAAAYQRPEPPTEPTLNDLWLSLTAHPDYIGGTVFQLSDLPEAVQERWNAGTLTADDQRKIHMLTEQLEDASTGNDTIRDLFPEAQGETLDFHE